MYLLFQQVSFCRVKLANRILTTREEINRRYFYCIVTHFCPPMKCYLVCHKGQLWDLSFSIYSWMICVVWQSILSAISLLMTSKCTLEKIYAFDSWLLQFDANCVRMWWISNFMKLNANKNRAVFLCRKTNYTGVD